MVTSAVAAPEAPRRPPRGRGRRHVTRQPDLASALCSQAGGGSGPLRPPLAEQATSFGSPGSERQDGRGGACVTWPRPQSRPDLLTAQLSLPLPAPPSGAPLCGGCEARREPEGRGPCLSHVGLFRTGLLPTSILGQAAVGRPDFVARFSLRSHSQTSRGRGLTLAWWD